MRRNIKYHINKLNKKDNVMEKFNQLKQLLEDVETDAVKFFEMGNKAAGTRVRKAMMEVKVQAQEVRKEVQSIKNKTEE